MADRFFTLSKGAFFRNIALSFTPGTAGGFLCTIKNSANWSDFGIEVVALAKNGLQGLELCKSLRPDIIITDIKMPYMDGLELLENIKDLDYSPKIIVISGYDDFSYAQKALKNNAHEYLLKPIKPAQLVEVVLNSSRDVSVEKMRKQNEIKLWQKIDESLPVIKQRFFRDLAEGYQFSEKGLIEKLEFLKIPFNMEGTYCTMLITLDGYERVTENIPEHNRQLVHYMVLEDLQNQEGLHVWEDRMGQYGVIVDISGKAEQYLELRAEKLLLHLQNSYSVGFTIGLGNAYSNLTSIPVSWTQAKKAMSYSLIVGQGQIIKYWEITEVSDVQQDYDLKLEEEVLSALKNLDKVSLYQAVEDYLKYCVENVPYQYIKAMFSKLLFSAIMQITQSGEKVENCMENWLEVSARIQQSGSIEEMKKDLYTALSHAVEYMTESRKTSDHHVIVNVVKYLKNHYSEGLSLKVLSEKFYLSPNYICNLFKKEMGKTIGDYLTEIRIEKAKEFLMYPQFKIYEVAKKVGYNDSRYFSNLFKKHTGMSTTKYRSISEELNHE